MDARPAAPDALTVLAEPDPGAVTAAASAAPRALRILIVSEHASAEFGGEAALPLHYFRVLRQRGVPVWLVTHARTRTELRRLFGDDPAIRYVEDNWFHKAMWQLGRHMPARIAYFTVGFASRLAAQMRQRRIVRALVRAERIDVVHQPMPVSPREPSLMYGFGVPVVIGPMNGGMDFPDGFARPRRSLEEPLLALGRWAASALNFLMPGKRRAALLLVANERTRRALPANVSTRVAQLVENGVDLGLWRPAAVVDASGPGSPTTVFVFLGRLVDWKAVDLLIEAFASAAPLRSMQLLVIGDGNERAALQALADRLGVRGTHEGDAGKVWFTGWLPQEACAALLRRADALVLPSLLECGGAVVLEAMSMGKPVIATAWGGPVDYLDASCGVLIDPLDRRSLVRGLTSAMLRLASDPPARDAMGARGREKVLREYDWDIKVDQMLLHYADVVASARSA